MAFILFITLHRSNPLLPDSVILLQDNFAELSIEQAREFQVVAERDGTQE
jgi:hypothetical protein